MDRDVVLYKEREGTGSAVRSATTSGTRVTNPIQIRYRLHGGRLSRRYGSDIIAIKAVAIQKDRVHIRYLYEFHCTLTDDVWETLRVVSTYDLYVWDSDYDSNFVQQQIVCIKKYTCTRPKVSVRCTVEMI